MSAFRARPAPTASASMTRTRPRPASASAASTLRRTQQSQPPPQQRRAPPPRDIEGELLSAHMHQSLHISQSDKERLIESLASEQNGYLLMLLEKEQSNEAERVRLLSSVDEAGDARRLEKIFAIERAKASAVIKAVTKEHERALAVKMHELGVISDEEDDEYMR